MTDAEKEEWIRQAAKVDAYEEAERQRIYRMHIKENVPSGLIDKTFAAYQCYKPRQADFCRLMKDAAAKMKDGSFLTICLLGTYGIGKTHLSIAVMQEVLSSYEIKNYSFQQGSKIITESYERPRTARYKLIDQIREEYEEARSFNSDYDQGEIIRRYTKCDLLILDEIGRSTNAKTEQEILYKIINERDLAKKSSILISNMNFADFSSYIGGATMDRLKNSAVFPNLNNIDSMRGLKK